MSGHDETPQMEPASARDLGELTRLLAERRRLEYEESVLLARVHTAGTTDVECGHRTPAWLAETDMCRTSTARRRVRVAARLHECFPVLAAAFEAGEVSWDHVKAFDRAANPRIEAGLARLLPGLVDLARAATFDRWVIELRGIADRLDADGGHDPARDPASNRLTLTPTFDGLTHIQGTLVGELALMVKSILDAETDTVMARHRRDCEKTGEVLPARSQARAEAFGELFDRGAAMGPDGKMASPEVIAHWDIPTDTLTDFDGNVLSPSVMRWIIAAAFIRPFDVSGKGDPLRMGRLLRFANREQRRALAIRDGGCIFPGCNRTPSGCDAHHVDEWDDGGLTDIENLALLCRHHHRVTHRRGWTMLRDPDRPDQTVFKWITPAGRVIYSQRHHTSIPA